MDNPTEGPKPMNEGAQMQIPQQAVDEDHRLETVASGASEALAKHRWHWTLDETNADRVGIRAYAKAVGRAHSGIHRYAHGYAAFIKQDGHDIMTVSLAESMERATMGAETEAAVEKVAERHGVTFKTASQNHRAEAVRIRDEARDRAERKGTSVEAEIEEVSAWQDKAASSRAKTNERKAAMADGRYFEAEKLLLEAQRKLAAALNVIAATNWAAEHIELLEDATARVRAVLGLIDVALSGVTDVDWDSELQRLTA